MSKKLYVGNLSYSLNEQMLSDGFANFGTVVSARIITDRETGRSKGFGFVEMKEKSEAETAIKELNTHDLGGKKIVVNEARPKTDTRRSGGFGGGGNRGGNRSGGNRNGGDNRGGGKRW